MNLPFCLARRDTPAAADAYLIRTADCVPLAAACGRLGERPDVFPVRGGFLVVPRAPDARPLPGAVRLRRLSGDFYVPADADLVPALLADEMVALTRDHGLIFLPGGEALAFDPGRPLTADRWLAPPPVRRGAWEPFPPRPARTERLTTIERPAPPAAVIELLEGGQPDGADPLTGAGEGEPGAAGGVPEDARPPAGSPVKRLTAGLTLGAAAALAWLGKQLGAPGLARAGSDLARKALERVPRLSERLLGAQEAALREVLRQLQAGDIEKALRRAPAAVPDPDRPARIGTSADLGTRDPRYDLRSLIGSGGGPGTAWLGGGDVWAELAREYRRLAEEAAARGDARRAAYLYGVLLRDLRAAANALTAGGLFRDAARLYRDKLHDLSAAAAAFERAGDCDEALRLYERLGHFEDAGELLRRLGDEDRAVEFFTRAADRHAGAGRWLAAGDLLRKKAARGDLATDYYRRGWEAGGAEVVACGERLLDEYAVTSDGDAIFQLIEDAAERFAPPRARDAGRFLNYALTFVSGCFSPDARDDLADRVRLLFASHLREAQGRAGVVVDELFGHGGVWPGPVVRDASFAVRRLRERPTQVHDPVIRLGDGTVTAVAVVRDTFDVVVATTTAVTCWRVDTGRVEAVAPAGDGVVRAVSATPAGEIVYTLRAGDDDVTLACYLVRSPGRFAETGRTRLSAEGGTDWYLQPSARFDSAGPVVTVVGLIGWNAMTGLQLLCKPSNHYSWDSRTAHFLAEGPIDCVWAWDELFVRYRPNVLSAIRPRRWVSTWIPGVPGASTLTSPPLDWLLPVDGVLEIVAPDKDGVLHWSEFDARPFETVGPRIASVAHPDGFTAACLTAPGLVAAVTGRNELHWLRVAGPTLTPRAAARRLEVPARAVFVASRPHANEVVVVFADGSAVRVPRA